MSIDEVAVPGPIAGVGTSTAAFIGPARQGPINELKKLTNWIQFVGLFGDFIDPPRVFVTHAVDGFSRNGGSTCYFVRIGTAQRASRKFPDILGTNTALTITALREGADHQISIQISQTTVFATTLARAYRQLLRSIYSGRHGRDRRAVIQTSLILTMLRQLQILQNYIMKRDF